MKKKYASMLVGAFCLAFYLKATDAVKIFNIVGPE